MATKPPRKKQRRGKSKTRSVALQSFNLDSALQLSHPDPAKQRALAGYLKHGTITGATHAAAIDRGTWYAWLESDPQFAALAADATEAVADALEQEAHQRAKKGSDTLLIFLLKSLRRGKFGDRVVLTTIAPEVQRALRQTLELIASQPTWESDELMQRMEPFWK